MLIEPRALLASSVLGRHPLGGRHPVRPGCKVMGCPKGSNDGFKACRNWGFESLGPPSPNKAASNFVG